VSCLEPWLIDYSSFDDSRGSLRVLDNLFEIAFIPQRIFMVSGIPDGVSRGAHAHKEAWQLLIAINGIVDVEVENSHYRFTYQLSPSDKALCVPPNNWLEFRTQNSNTSLVVLASTTFDENDYFYERPMSHDAPDRN
jgi:dTDP-4-dehydrorhamnose 3,5-epimerase-like enzyme